MLLKQDEGLFAVDGAQRDIIVGPEDARVELP